MRLILILSALLLATPVLAKGNGLVMERRQSPCMAHAELPACHR